MKSQTLNQKIKVYIKRQNKKATPEGIILPEWRFAYFYDIWRLFQSLVKNDFIKLIYFS